MTTEALHEIAHTDCVHVTAAVYMYYLLSILRCTNARERFSYRRCVDFAPIDRARCNNYFARSKPIMAQRTSGKYKSCV